MARNTISTFTYTIPIDIIGNVQNADIIMRFHRLSALKGRPVQDLH